MNLLELSPPVLAAVSLALLWIFEAVAPMFAQGGHSLRARMRNIAFALANAALAASVFAGLLLWVTHEARVHGFGLLHVTEWPAWLEWLTAFLLLDLFHYAAHVAFHRVPVLWRFHLVHHTETHLNVTTAMRFHMGEIAVQTALLVPVVALVGATMPQILLYQAVLLPVAMFHHADVRLPERIDRVLRIFIVTPRMHWVHHSSWQPETDSNYSNVLSVWDRIAGTFRRSPDPHAMRFGIEGYDAEASDTLRGMLVTPFEPVKSEFGTPPAYAAGTPDASVTGAAPARRPSGRTRAPTTA